MGVLVEDLLTLARLDEAARPSRASRSTSRTLARDAVDDARAVAPDRAIDARGRRPGASCSATANQLRQVLANLLRNALVHTPRGHADRGARCDGDGRRGRARGARPRPRPARPTTPTSCSSASGAPSPAASAAAAEPGSGWRSSPPSSPRTAAASRRPTPTAAARPSWSASRRSKPDVRRAGCRPLIPLCGEKDTTPCRRGRLPAAEVAERAWARAPVGPRAGPAPPAAPAPGP